MSKKNRRQSTAPLPYERPSKAISYTIALKPRPRLLLLFSLVLALWIGVLLTLYFKTVYPTRHNRTLPSSVDNPE